MNQRQIAYFTGPTVGGLLNATCGNATEMIIALFAVIGCWSAFGWLAGMTIIIALLSEYVVGTIEAASNSWGIFVTFISIILLPIVGNAAEHAGSIIFALKNKLDISLGVSLGSASQISMFVVPLSVIVAWIMGIEMDLDFSLLETGSLAFTIIITTFTLQSGIANRTVGETQMNMSSSRSHCVYLFTVQQELKKNNRLVLRKRRKLEPKEKFSKKPRPSTNPSQPLEML